MRSTLRLVLLASIVAVSGRALPQDTVVSYTGGTSGTGVAFGSSFASGRFLLTQNQQSHLQGIIGDPKDTTNGTDAGAILILPKPGSTAPILTIQGGQAGALYGFAIANIGDLDGDGFDEFAVGAPKQNSNGADAGSVFIYDGKTGAQIHKHDGDAAGDQLGYAIAGIGDADMDGIPDYVVGAPFNDAGGTDAGRVKVFSGANYSVLKTFNGDNAGDNFGTAICGLFIYGSYPYTHTFAEFAVGAPNNNGGGANSGLVRAIYSQNWSTTYNLHGASAHQLFGSSLANVGYDASSPSQIQFVAGAPGDDANGANAGSAYLFDSQTGNQLHHFVGNAAGDQLGAAVGYGGAFTFGFTHGMILLGAPFHDVGSNANAGLVYCYDRDYLSLLWKTSGDTPNGKLGSLVTYWEATPSLSGPPPIQSSGVLGEPGVSKLLTYTVLSGGFDQHGECGVNLVGNGFGSAVARGGDIDNNGSPDVIVGSPNADGDAKNAGRVDVVAAGFGEVSRTYLGDETGAAFGAAVGGNTDVDNDGRPDVIVGAPHHSNGSLANAGAVYVYSGKTGALLQSHFGSAAGNQLGASVCGAGDLDGDGFGDIVVGVPHSDGNGTDSGRVRVYSGQTGGVLYTWDGDAAGDHFGECVARVLDVNNDGFDDIAVGAPDHVYGGLGASTGFVRVFSGKDGSVLFTLHGYFPARLGLSVAAARDVDGDGVVDIVAGALNQGSGVQLINRGAVLVFSGATGNAIDLIGGGLAYQHLGASVAGLGDINEDGFGEFAVGALGDSGIFAGAGFVNIYDGPTTTPLYTVKGNSLGDQFGAAIAVAGDGNSDGALDLVVGAPGVTANGVSGVGSVKVFSFAPSGLTTYGTGTPGCQGTEIMYGNLTPSVGNPNFQITTQKSAPTSLSLGLVTNVQVVTPFDTFGLGILMDVNLYAATEVYTLDIPTDGLGHGAVAVPIPNNPGLAGKHYYGQVISYWPSGPCSPSPINLSSSFGLDILIQ